MYKSKSNPILIGGDGRTGTTLLSVVLDSHPDLVVGPELHFRGPVNLGPYILRCLDLRDQATSVDAWLELKKDPDLYAGVHFVNRCHRFGVDSKNLRLLIQQTMAQTNSPLDNFGDRCQLVDALGAYNMARTNKRRWGIKIMRDLRILKQYAQVWPNAQFIHMIRDGRDVAASQMIEHGSWGYADIEQAAGGWVDLIERTRKLAAGLSMLEVRYEDLVTKPQATIQRLLGFLGVSWDDRVMRHHDIRHSLFENHYQHPSIDTVVQPINSSAVGRYRKDLSPEQIDRFNSIARTYLVDLGYTI